MSHEYPRNLLASLPLDRTKPLRGSQAPDRDINTTMQMNRAQQHLILTGFVAILWDMENCPVPSEVRADDVAGNIRMALRLHPVIRGAVTFFSAYGDFNHFPKKVREGCQRTGVNLIDVPNGKKDASDKAILVDLFLFALDNPPPCTVFLISGDVDFAPALHKLGQRGYTVVLAIPSGVGVSSALCSAGRYVWDWPSVARGGGLVPAKNFSYRGSADDRMAEIVDMNGYVGQSGAAWSPNDDSDPGSDDQILYEEEQIVWKSPAQRPVDHHVTDGVGGAKLDAESLPSLASSQMRPLACSAGSVQLGELSSAQTSLICSTSTTPYCLSSGRTSSTHPPVIKEFKNQATVAREIGTFVRAQVDSMGSTTARGNPQLMAGQTGNLQSLREQLVRLLNVHGGKLELVRVPAEYLKQYGRPLYLAEYGCAKLVHLLERLREWLSIRGEGINKTLHLTKTRSRATPKAKRDAKNGRCASGEEIEVSERSNIQFEDLADVKYETAAENGVACMTRPVETLIEEAQTLTLGNEDLHSRGQFAEDLEEIQLPTYEWGFGSSGSGDEKDNDPEEEKDVEVDESTFEQVLKNEGNTRAIGATDVLEVFRQELQELLVSHACKIVLNSFAALYEQRYSQVLDCSKFGVQNLESLIDKVSDIAVMMEEPGSSLRFLVANCGS